MHLYFTNDGTVRKVSGMGVNSFSGDYSDPFVNHGLVEVLSGVVSFSRGLTSSGSFLGPGAVVLEGTVSGTLVGPNFVLGGGTVYGTFSNAGTLNWTGGML